MADPGVTIAEAVKAALEAGSYSQAFDVTRTYLPRLSLASGDLDALQVLVVPGPAEGAWANRSQQEHLHQVDVAVCKKVAEYTNATLDPLLGLLRELADDLVGERLGLEVQPDDRAICTGWQYLTGAEAGYAPDLLEKLTFVAVCRLTYRLIR